MLYNIYISRYNPSTPPPLPPPASPLTPPSASPPTPPRVWMLWLKRWLNLVLEPPFDLLVKLLLPPSSFFLRRQASSSFTVELLLLSPPRPSPTWDGDAFLNLGLFLRLRASSVVFFIILGTGFQILHIYKINLVSSVKEKKKNNENRFTLGLFQIKGLERREWRKTQRRWRIERKEIERKKSKRSDPLILSDRMVDIVIRVKSIDQSEN